MKRITGIILALALCFGAMGTVALAVENTAEKVYTIDLNQVPDEDFDNSKIKVVFEVPDKATVVGTKELGFPIRLDISSLNGGVTFIPLRLIANNLGVPIEWVEKTDKEEAHAVITTANHGTVKLYMGATSITSSDGTVYEETTYKFPDGTAIPLILSRNGRLYVPVRFLSTFVLGDVRFEWGANATILYIKGQNDVVDPGYTGIGPNLTLWFYEEDPLKDLPNTRAVAEKYGRKGTINISGNAVSVVTTSVQNVGNALEITGFEYSANDKESYEVACALIQDVCDKESADALIKWISEVDSIVTDCWAGIKNDEEISDKLKSCPTTFKNINVELIVSDTGYLKGFIIKPNS